MKRDKYKVILVDDNHAFIDAVKTILSFKENIEVIGVAHDGIEFLELLSIKSPDIVLMDVNMPRMDGILATKKGLIENSAIKVVGVTMSDDIDIHLDMMHFGFTGGILKNQFTSQFDYALNAIALGDVYFPLLN